MKWILSILTALIGWIGGAMIANVIGNEYLDHDTALTVKLICGFLLGTVAGAAGCIVWIVMDMRKN